MPCWSEILDEIRAEEQSLGDFFLACKKVVQTYISKVGSHTGRFVVFYGSCWLQKPGIGGYSVGIHDSDMEGFLECVYHAKGKKELDLIMHSPGGSPEAVEKIVTYLRQKFETIRVIVPMQAMSAATMLALAADEICMSRHSTLGPTDPQLLIPTHTGHFSMVSAHEIIADFERAKQEGGSPIFNPILSQYPPGILARCEHALALTKELVVEWLRNKGLTKEDAERIADFFAGPHHHTHGRPLMYGALQSMRSTLRISLLEDDQTLQDHVMSLYHAMSHMFAGTTVVKAIICQDTGYLRYFNKAA